MHRWYHAATGDMVKTFICNLIRKINLFQVYVSVYKDHRLERTDLTIVYDRPLIGAGPETILFQELEDYELSDKVSSLGGYN
jgi:hypothetical protein